MNKKLIIVIFFVMFFSGGLYLVTAQEGKNDSCFSKSLHFTGEGMRYWYEEKGGFKNITGIPYQELGCKNCHVKNCDQCHLSEKNGKCSYSTDAAIKNETCLKCHTRAKATIKINKEQGLLDVHFQNNMTCVDCHNSHDVHGDGTLYRSMRKKNAVSASCEDCHDPEDTVDIKAHTAHKNLHCTACHVKATTTCMNCHFGNFLETGKKKGNFLPPSQTWTLLINYQGKVVPANIQSLVYKNKKFIAYAPYFTHSIQKKGKQCSDCHANKAMQLIKKGESVPMLSFKDGEFIHWNGVVPVVPNQLEWTFFDKKKDNWVPLRNDEKPIVQFVGYGAPLTKKQINSMAMNEDELKKQKKSKKKGGFWNLLIP
ncbi:conserved hypothetical protein [Candidatus Magnetomoraceae bacterium gMMP-15]